MLNVENGLVKFKGDKQELLLEVSVLIFALIRDRVCTKEDFLIMLNSYDKNERIMFKQKLINYIDNMDDIGSAFSLLMQIIRQED